MFVSVSLYLTVTYLVQLCSTYSSFEEFNHYECGAHGKFEYCINNIPDCVVGCHCHPGYYFDTDTKICEPNIKLAEAARRRYVAEPTPDYPRYSPFMTEPTTTTTNVLDERIDEIARNTDDLGDWLYNQFFKTIETQVINNTDDQPKRRLGGDGLQLSGGTRRSGNRKEIDSELSSGTIKVKTRKSLKGRGKKKKTKSRGLRRKLLRITEDDSLFDSDSDEESGSLDDSSDSSSSSYEGSKEEEKGGSTKAENSEHGHKKVIIFNRRPRPPLPSFIFVPSMDTPYYPPIGLPPPPVLPMYPMVPVPPMAPCFPPIDANNVSTVTTSSTAATTVSGHNDIENGSTITTEPEERTATTETSPTETTAAPSLLRNEKHKQKLLRNRKPPTFSPRMRSSEETFMIRSKDIPKRKSAPTKNAERIKLMKKLKEILKKKNKLHNELINNKDFMNLLNESDRDSPDLDETPVHQYPSPQSSYPRKHKYRRVLTDEDDDLNDVNFKYITELIHRHKVNGSKKEIPSSEFNDNLNRNQLQNTRRFLGQQKLIMPLQDTTVMPPNLQKPDDAYFSNLGRQIASLIRNIGPNLDSNTRKDQNYQDQSYDWLINSNNFAPGSFWERSVRSPLQTFKNYEYFNKYKKLSSEKNLFSIEDEVNIFASTTPPLSLQELENILSNLEKKQVNNKEINKNTELSKTGANDIYPSKKTTPSHQFSKNLKDSPKSIPNTQLNLTNKNVSYYLDPTHIDLPITNDWMFDYKRFMNPNPSRLPLTKNTTLVSDVSRYNSKPTVKSYSIYNTIGKQDENANSRRTMSLSTPEIKNKPEQPVKYPELLAKFREIPLKYPDLLAKYPEIPTSYSERPENYPDLSINRAEILENPELPFKYPEMIGKYLQLPVKSQMPTKFADMPLKPIELLDKYPELSANQPTLPENYPKLPAIYTEHSAKYTEPLPKSNGFQKNPEMPGQFNELIVNNPDLLTKYNELPYKNSDVAAKYTGLLTKNPELFTKYSEHEKYTDFIPKNTARRMKQSELPARYNQLLNNNPELHTKYPELQGKYTDLLAEHPELLMKYPELRKKYSEASNPKYPELSGKYYNNNAVNYHYTPTLVNYKTLDYFNENDKKHYVFRAAFPSELATHEESYAKRTETDPNNPTYFHHEFHHFNFFD